MLHSSDNCYVPFRRPVGRSIRVSLNCKRRGGPIAKRAFFRRNVSFSIGRCLLSTITAKAISTVKSSTRRNVCRAVHCNGCRIACERLSGIFTGFSRDIGTNRAVTVDNSLLRVRIEFSKRRVGPLRFLAVLCNGVGTLRRGSRVNVGRLSVGVPSPCSASHRRVRTLVLHFLPSCFRSLRRKTCSLPRRARRSLEGVFSLKTDGRCFCRAVPDVTGPLNVNGHYVPLTAGIRGLLVTSFLGCLTVQRRMCLSAVSRILGGGSGDGP